MSGPPNLGTQYPELNDVAKAFASELISIENISKLWQGSEPTLVKLIEIALGTVIALVGSVGAELAKAIVNAEDIAEPAFRKLARVALKDITGVDAPELGGLGGGDGRRAVARNLGAGIIRALTSGRVAGTGGGGELTPSLQPAEDYVGFVTQMALEGWLTDLLGEMMTLGAVEQLGDLDDALAQSLGLGRSSRAVMAPLIDILVATPAEWALHKAYTPKLLTPEQAVKQYARGRWSAEQLLEELGRQGYSDQRIEALINAARKFPSSSDLYVLWRHGQITRDEFLQTLRDQGVEAADAEREFTIERARRVDSYERTLAAAIVDAYVNRRIDGGDFDRLLGAAVRDDDERARARELGETRRTLNRRDLSEADAREATLRGILSVIDYRRTLEGLGYTDEAVAVKELLLRDQIRSRDDAEEAKRRRAEELATERAAREAERQRRRDELEAARAVTEPSLGQAARFVVRGIWSTGQYADFLRSERYDADTVAALVADVEISRERWLEAEARRAVVESQAARRALSLAQLEAAVLRGVLSLGDYRGAVAAAGFVAADVDVLARTLEERLEERRALEARRGQLGGADPQKGLSLADAETAVLRGIGTLADFDAWLRGEGYPDFDRAVLVRLLELQLADQAALEARRAEQEAAAARRRVPLTAIRRAVLLGLRDQAAYAAALVEAGVGAEERVLLTELLARDVELQAAAVARRAEASARRRPRRLSLAQLEAVVRAGFLSPDDYRAELTADGWSARDVELLTALLLDRLAAERAAAAPTETEPAGAVAPTVTLADLARAVRAGVTPITTYRAALEERGYTAADVALLVELLETQIAADLAATERKAAAEAEAADLAAREAALADAVRAGTSTLAVYRENLEAAGVDAIDAALLAAVLGAALEDLRWAELRRLDLVLREPGIELALAPREAALRAGTLTRAQFLAELAGLGLDVADQAALVLWAEGAPDSSEPAAPPAEGS